MFSSNQTATDVTLEQKNTDATLAAASIPDAPALTPRSSEASEAKIAVRSVSSFDVHVCGTKDVPVTNINIPLRAPKTVREISELTGFSPLEVMLNQVMGNSVLLSAAAVEALVDQYVQDLKATAEPTQHIHARFFMMNQVKRNAKPVVEAAPTVDVDAGPDADADAKEEATSPRVSPRG